MLCSGFIDVIALGFGLAVGLVLGVPTAVLAWHILES